MFRFEFVDDGKNMKFFFNALAGCFISVTLAFYFNDVKRINRFSIQINNPYGFSTHIQSEKKDKRDNGILLVELQQSLQSCAQSFKNFIFSMKDRSERKHVMQAFKNETVTICNSMVQNAREGELGKRGEELVVISAGLLLCIFLDIHPFSVILRLGGIIGFLLGALLLGSSILELKEQVSLFITPVSNHKLITSGVYRFARHPMYGGLLLLSIGWSLATRSAEKMALCIILGFILHRKSEREEDFLRRLNAKVHMKVTVNIANINAYCCYMYLVGIHAI